MVDYAYERVSTDKQSTERQTYTLAQAGVSFARTFSDPATTSRISPLNRPEFSALMSVANPGDTIHVSEMFRLVRSVRDLHDVLDLFHKRGVALKIHSGAFSSIDLTARNPKTGKLSAEVKFLVTCLGAAGEFQRDLQSELTLEGQATARAKGKHMGRKPAADADAVRADFRKGTTSIAALARIHGVSRGAVRTALGDLYAPPVDDTPEPQTPKEPALIIEMPGTVADFLTEDGTAAMETGTDTHKALSQAETRRYGKSYALRVLAPLGVHQELLSLAWVLAGGEGREASKTEIKAYGKYAERIERAQAAV